ncbi:hypothetical protein [Stenotrophomonas sepilia]|uniref:hypothetical protein n=1 Tax=Stenotrophomonas sepilia TaxID=2860290 RepID=UPI003341D373
MNLLRRLLFKICGQRFSAMKGLCFKQAKRVHHIHGSTALGRIVHRSLDDEYSLATCKGLSACESPLEVLGIWSEAVPARDQPKASRTTCCPWSATLLRL